MSDEITDGQTIISKHPSNYNLRLNIFYDGRQKVRVTEEIRVGPKNVQELHFRNLMRYLSLLHGSINVQQLSCILCKCMYL